MSKKNEKAHRAGVAGDVVSHHRRLGGLPCAGNEPRSVPSAAGPPGGSPLRWCGRRDVGSPCQFGDRLSGGNDDAAAAAAAAAADADHAADAAADHAADADAGADAEQRHRQQRLRRRKR